MAIENQPSVESSLRVTSTLHKSGLRKFLKRLNNYIKFYIFEFWTSRKFKIYRVKNFEDYLRIYRLRYKVYCEEYNYLDPKKYPDKSEKDQYDAYSEHFVLSSNYIENGDENGIVGYVRLILDSKEGFPIEKHFKLNYGDITFDRHKSAEVSRLIVSAEYRRFHLILLLIRAMYQFAKKEGIEYIFCVMDDHLLHMLKKMSFPFYTIGPYTKYQGMTCPNLMRVSEMEDCLKQKNKLLASFFNNKKI